MVHFSIAEVVAGKGTSRFFVCSVNHLHSSSVEIGGGGHSVSLFRHLPSSARGGRIHKGVRTASPILLDAPAPPDRCAFGLFLLPPEVHHNSPVAALVRRVVVDALRSHGWCKLEGWEPDPTLPVGHLHLNCDVPG